MNSGLANKVTDNKNGTIEVNGSSITPADNNTINAELNNKVTDNKNGSIEVNGSSITPADNNTVNAELNNKVTDNKNGSITVNGATFIPVNSTGNNTLSGTNNFTGSIQHNGNPVGAHIQASKNDEASAISDSTKGNSDDIYYWCEN